MYCYDGTTGVKLWESLPVADTFANCIPAISNGRLYTISNSATNGVVYCFDLTTHAVVWSYTTNTVSNQKNHPSIGYGNLYIGTNTKLFCLNLTTPTPPVWIYSSNNRAALNPLVADGKVYVQIRTQGLKCLDAFGSGGTTTLIWKFDQTSNYCPAIAYNTIYYPWGNRLYAFGSIIPPAKPTITGPIKVAVNNSNYAPDFTANATDPEGFNILYNFSWGDGNYTGWIPNNPIPSGTPVQAHHTWVQTGHYNITVKAKNILGGINVSDPFSIIVVEDHLPTIVDVNGPTQGAIGIPLTFTITANDSDNDDITYSLSASHAPYYLYITGNGHSGEPVQLILVFPVLGNWNLNFQTTDWSGMYGDSTSRAITIINHNPAKPTITGPSEGIVDNPYTFTIVSTDPDTHNLTYSVNWGDNTIDSDGPYQSGTSFSASHTWNTTKSYTITVNVADPWSGYNSGTKTMVITRGPILNISSISGGLFFVKAVIKNDGPDNATNINWSISVNGSSIFLGKETTGFINTIRSNETVALRSLLIFGVGKITITVHAICAEEERLQE